jgi:hypothetical protein
MGNFDKDFNDTLVKWQSNFEGYMFRQKTTDAGRKQVHVFKKAVPEADQPEELVCVASCAGGFCALLSPTEERLKPKVGEDALYLSHLTAELEGTLSVV